MKQSMGRRLAVLGCASLLLASASGAADSGATVAIENMVFTPAVLTVERGQRVTWINKDLFPHTATAADVFDSKDMAPGASWSYVADKPGRYDYVCKLHPTMKGTLVVK